MTRSKRMQVVQKVVDDRESRQAVQLGRASAASPKLKKLLELERYQLDYQREFTRRAKSGSSGLGLGDFRVFLARLTDAVAQQKAIVAKDAAGARGRAAPLSGRSNEGECRAARRRPVGRGRAACRGKA